MNEMLLLRVGVGASIMLLIGGVLMLRQMSQHSRLEQRIGQIHTGRSIIGGAGTAPASRSLWKLLSGVGQGVMRSGVVSGQTAAVMQQKMQAAGIRNPNAVGTFMAAKISLALVLPALVLLGTHNSTMGATMHNVLVAAAAVAGLLAPDYVLGSLRKRYQASLANGLPDALDMLVMCAESGLSLEPAMHRVGTEIHGAHPSVSAELMLTCSEFQMSTDSAAVLNALGDRTGLKDMKRVVATLAQTLQYGTPLAEALRVLSAEMRAEILTRFEEKAAKLPVLLTLPMILFILPSLFMVVGGPAIIQALRLFNK